MDSRLSQHKGHDPRLISILEILGSYFVDVYFNHVYNSAGAGLADGKSLTDEYVRRVRAYIIGVKTDSQCYTTVANNLHTYFQATTRFSSMTFNDFVERITEQFVPPEYFSLLQAREKDETLGSVIVDLASGLGAYVTSPDVLRRVIDEHDRTPRVTIRMLQDQSITILIAKRAEIHNSFLKRVGQVRDSVPADVVENMKKILRRLAKEKSELTAENEKLTSRVEDLEADLASARTREAKYKKLTQLLIAERNSGQTAAAFAAAVPPRERIAEDFDTSRSVASIRPDNLAENVEQRDEAAKPAAKSASFFAKPAAASKTFFAKPAARGKKIRKARRSASSDASSVASSVASDASSVASDATSDASSVAHDIENQSDEEVMVFKPRGARRAEQDLFDFVQASE